MANCLCGCGQDIATNTTGRPGKFYSSTCRVRYHRQNKNATKLANDVTKHDMLNQIVLGDCRDLIKSIPDASIDLIFTDPPYPREFLPLYGWLGKEAARVLKPGGFLLTYAGGMYKHDVMMHLGKNLNYFWDYLAIDSGAGTPVWPRRTVAHHKSILAYVKGEGKPRCQTQGAWLGLGKDKRFHAWGQDVSTARYYIDCFSHRDEIVLEPFTGGGTTLVACKLLDRQFIGFEVDVKNAEIAKERLCTMQMPLLDMNTTSQLTLDGEAI